MENLKFPASPLPIARHDNGTLMTTFDVSQLDCGFTKLELASLMIAQGLQSHPNFRDAHHMEIAIKAVNLAKTVLEEANK